ncbi:MAG: excalibur calcium-binding domain-containing protein [Cyanobacteria bacterium CAN_BIN43]|nr:excalibur calcium-binding domain-containing protein [Cyanobacteria bacterium CAN_BIN43]
MPAQGQTVTNGAIANAQNCKELAAIGVSDFQTESGSRFDRDGDGIGCESN